ncbi:hypothetical protein HDU92_006937 [Lobulomyces angularis]|nr:hypothetical protein HDU92_006937 [Lobulomyces angularis]
MENYISSQREQIFRNCEVLIYVFDIQSLELEKDFLYYKQVLENILRYSPDCKIFCLIHKMDLIQEDQQLPIFKEREQELINLSLPLTITCFKTSIWDESLYGAWSAIVYALIPNVKILEQNLNKFCDILDADEIVLFEKTTFLFISHVTKKQKKDNHRFEKICNIIKHFKQCCGKSQAQFLSMEVKNSQFSAYIESLTSNTFVLVIMSDTTIQSAATLINIKAARKHFETIGIEDKNN